MNDKIKRIHALHESAIRQTLHESAIRQTLHESTITHESTQAEPKKTSQKKWKQEIGMRWQTNSIGSRERLNDK